MYQLILVFTKNSVNGACMHSQIVGLYGSKEKAEEAASSIQCKDREFYVSPVILPAPDCSTKQVNQNINI